MLEQAERSPAPAPTSRRRATVSVVMPCLNESETLAQCILAAQEGLRDAGLDGEVIVADNGSHDGSQRIAEELDARVVSVERRGYGHALRAGIAAARGDYVVMGDSDLSYDFSRLKALIAPLAGGADLVMGNRFQGGIEQGAMPWPNRFIGNPVLSRLGRLFYGSPVGDFHCGLRAFRRQPIERLRLRSGGMEFASEMVVKASLHGLRLAEVPVRLRRDGRSRAPHLRRWRDGWRHLRFLLLYSPRWLFLYPGLVLMLASTALGAWLLPAERRVGGLGLDVHTLLVAAVLCLVGFQVVVFAVFTKVFAMREGYHPPDPALNRLFRHVTLETGLACGAVLTLAGVLGLLAAVLGWQAGGPHALDPRQTMRLVIPAATALALGVQTVFASFFLSILGIDSEK